MTVLSAVVQALETPHKKATRLLLVALGGGDLVEDVPSALTARHSQYRLACDLHLHLIEMPDVTSPWCAPPDARSDLGTELAGPPADGFVRDQGATSEQHLLHVP